MRFTVFTPAYNRAYTLTRLYESLCRQTFDDFEWVVVDDASTDNTAELLAAITQAHDGFPITVISRATNGGMHRARNQGVAAARGELFFAVDSDDYLPDDALQVIDEVERSIPASERMGFAGVCGLKAHFDGRPIGTTFTGTYLDITTIHRDRHAITGDKAEVVDTATMRRYPSPEFDGEQYVTAAVVWDRIAHDGFKLRFFNTTVYHAEYLPDGLTQDFRGLLRRSPKGEGLYVQQSARFGKWSRRHSISRVLAYVDDHAHELPFREVSANLGMNPLQLSGLLGLRWGNRQLRRLRRVTLRAEAPAPPQQP